MRTISLLGIDSVELFPRCAAINSKQRYGKDTKFIFADFYISRQLRGSILILNNRRRLRQCLIR